MLRVALLLLLAVRGAVALFESFSRWASRASPRMTFRALERMGKEIGQARWVEGGWQSRAAVAELPPRPFGRTEYGTHHICANRTYAQPCVALTCGVQNDYTFELDVRERLGCHVFGWIPQSTTMPSSPTASTSSSGARRARAASTHPRSRAATTRRRGHPRQGDVGAWLRARGSRSVGVRAACATSHDRALVATRQTQSAARARARTRSARVRHASTLGFVAVLVILTCCWWSWRRRQKE